MEEQSLTECLYFTSARLTRLMTRIAEEELAPVGLAPTYAYLMIVVNANPGIAQKELSEKLHIQPSTSTRFLDKLVVKGLVERVVSGKHTLIYLTPTGIALLDDIQRCLDNLCNRYSSVLGQAEMAALVQAIHLASEKLERRT